MEGFVFFCLRFPMFITNIAARIYFNLVRSTYSQFVMTFGMITLISSNLYFYFFINNLFIQIFDMTVFTFLILMHLKDYKKEDESAENNPPDSDTITIYVSPQAIHHVNMAFMFTMCGVLFLALLDWKHALWNWLYAAHRITLITHNNDEGKGKKVFSKVKDRLKTVRLKPVMNGV